MCVCLAASFTDIKANDISIRDHLGGPQFICNNYNMKDAFLGHTFRHFSDSITALRLTGLIFHTITDLKNTCGTSIDVFCLICSVQSVAGERVTHSSVLEMRHQCVVPGKYAYASSL